MVTIHTIRTTVMVISTRLQVFHSFLVYFQPVFVFPLLRSNHGSYYCCECLIFFFYRIKYNIYLLYILYILYLIINRALYIQVLLLMMDFGQILVISILITGMELLIIILLLQVLLIFLSIECTNIKVTIGCTY